MQIERQTHRHTQTSRSTLWPSSASLGDMCVYYYDLINKSDVRFSESVVTLPEFPKFAHRALQKSADMADSPDFLCCEIRSHNSKIFCVHPARFLENRLKNIGRLDKNRVVGPQHYYTLINVLLTSLVWFK